jgi:hypothetical protein
MSEKKPTSTRETWTAAICGAIVLQMILYWSGEIGAVIETIKKAGSW